MPCTCEAPEKAQIKAVRKFLGLYGVRTKTAATWVNSYTLKHIVERWSALGYISNGAAIEAALRLGLPVVPDKRRRSPNALIGVSASKLPHTVYGRAGEIFKARWGYRGRPFVELNPDEYRAKLARFAEKK